MTHFSIGGRAGNVIGSWKTLLSILAGLGVLLAALFASGVLGSLSAGSHSATAAKIDGWAKEIAAANGDPNPISVTWVESNRQAANAEIGAEVGASAATVPVFVLDIHGRFLVNHSVPPHVTIPSTTFLWVVIDRETGRTTDFGTSDNPVNLSALGRSETDSL